MATNIPIQNLDPSSTPPQNLSIRAIVILVWPYSSSNQQCALLLSDPDFRLRSKNGQVRVRFTGNAARAVAERRLGIGETLELGLEGAEWSNGGQESGRVQTPGKSVGELTYRGKLRLRVQRDGGEEEVIRVEGVNGQESNGTNWEVNVTPATPVGRPSAVYGLRSSFGSAPTGTTAVYSSPAFLRKSRLSNLEGFDNTYEGLGRLFSDDDFEAMQSPRKRARVSIGEVRDWRMVSRTPSPVKPAYALPVETIGQDQTPSGQVDGVEMNEQDDVSELPPSSPTPATAAQRAPIEMLEARPTFSGIDLSATSALDQLAASALNPELQSLPNTASLQMAPPPLPRLQVPSSPLAPALDDSEARSGPTTPHLQPIPSAGLPLPSPFPTDASLAQTTLLTATSREVPDSYNEEARTLAATQTIPQKRQTLPIPDTYVDEADKLVSSSPQRALQDTVAENKPVSEPLFEIIDSMQVQPDLSVVGPERHDSSPPGAETAVNDGVSSSDDSDMIYDDAHDDEVDDDVDDDGFDEGDAENVIDVDELEGEEPSEDESSEEYEDSDEEEDDSHVPDYVKYTGPPPRTYADSVSELEEEEDAAMTSSPAVQPRVEPTVTPSAQLTNTVSGSPAFVPASTLPRKESAEDQPSQPSHPPTDTLSQHQASQQTPQRPSAQRRSHDQVPAKTPATRIVSGFSFTAPVPRPLPDFGMDGALPDPITPIVLSREKDPNAPLSAHGRAMKKTLRSLFGYAKSPSPTKGGMPSGAGELCAEEVAEDEPGVSAVAEMSEETQEQGVASPPATKETNEQVGSAAGMPAEDASMDDSIPEPELPTESTPPQQQAPAEDAPRPSGVQVIDLGSSSDVEDVDDAPGNAPPVPREGVAAVAQVSASEKPSPNVADDTHASSRPYPQAPQSPGAEDPFILTGPEEERRRSEHAILEESPLQEQSRDQRSPLFSPNEPENQAEQLSNPGNDTTEMSSSYHMLESQPDFQDHGFHPLQVDDDEDPGMTVDDFAEHVPSSPISHEAHEIVPEIASSPAADLQVPSVHSSFQVLSSSPLPDAADKVPQQAINHLQRQADDVEMLDMSQAEPEPWFRASQVQSQYSLNQSQQSRRTVVDDSVESTQTSIAAESSSQPVSRDTVEDFSQTTAYLHSQQRSELLGFANSVMPSQELGCCSQDAGNVTVARSVREQSAYSSAFARTPSPGTHEVEAGIASPAAGTLKKTNERPSTIISTPPMVEEAHQHDKRPGVLVHSQAQSELGLSEARSSFKATAKHTNVIEDSVQAASQAGIAEPTDRVSTEVLFDSQTPSKSPAQSFPFEMQLPMPEPAHSHLPPVAQSVQRHSHADSALQSSAAKKPMDAEEQNPVQEPPENAVPVEQMQPPKTPHRKSLKSRLSSVPNVISAWFSPKRSNVDAREVEALSTADDSHTEQHIDQIRRQASGYSTAHSYYTSLASLEKHLNPSSQQVYGGPNTVDILAVVTDFAKPPERAKGGPRDYFTIFHITDLTLPRASHVRVEVYRPWKAVLPAADVGDVVLLRGFLVKSKKRQPYLLSTDASAWCVWRFDDQKQVRDEEASDKPIWARKRAGSDVREEVKGPPVEYGEAERTQVAKLREWWVAYKRELEVGEGDEEADHGTVGEATNARL